MLPKIFLVLLAITIAIIILIVSIKKNETENEPFYPRRWRSHPYWRWGWRRPWLFDYGNWRHNTYYPAYSGYWKQCPSGSWCPPYKSCLAPECS